MTNVQIIADRDTFISPAYPTTNYGTNPALNIGYCNTAQYRRTLIGFDLSSIPVGAVISSAHLKMKQEGANEPDASSKINIISEDWGELTATWNLQPTIGDLITTFTSGLGDLDIDVTDTVKTWFAGTLPNYGIRLMTSETGYSNSSYDSREAQSGKPYLDITYTLPAPAKFRAKIYLIGYIPSFLFVAFLKKEIKIIWQTLLGSLQGKKPSRSWQPAQT
jgi:hypothetical protein